MRRRRSRTKRILSRAMRAPAALDRPGLRWLLQLLSPAPVVILVHRGRRTGKRYRTPVEAIAEDAERGEIIVSPMWGGSSDWYRNVVAGGLIELRRGGEGHEMGWRQLTEDENRQALMGYRREHPVYGRAILWGLARMHRVSGEDRLEGVAAAIPMLALREQRRRPA